MTEYMDMHMVISIINQSMTGMETWIEEKIKETEDLISEELERTGVGAECRVSRYKVRMGELKQEQKTIKSRKHTANLILKMLESYDRRLKALENDTKN